MSEALTLLARIFVQLAAVVVTETFVELFVFDNFDHVLAAAIISHTHTHTHTERERERSNELRNEV